MLVFLVGGRQGGWVPVQGEDATASAHNAPPTPGDVARSSPIDAPALVPAAFAPAAVTPAAAGPGAKQRGAALALLRDPWLDRLEGWTIEFLPARVGYLGATWARTKRIEIYVGEGQTLHELAFTLAHELGHALDVTLLDVNQRDQWLQARGVPKASWWGTSGDSDYGVGAGDWAEAFAVWQVGGPSYSTLAGALTPAQLELLAQLLAV